MGGIIGRLFREFAVTVSVAVRRLGRHLADPDAGDVLAVSEGSEGLHPRAASTGRPSASSRRCCAPTTAASSSSFATSSSTLLATLAADGRDRLPLHDDPEGLFPAAGYRLHLRPGRGAPGHLLSPISTSMIAREVVDIVRQDPGRLGRLHLRRRHAVQSRPRTPAASSFS